MLYHLGFDISELSLGTLTLATAGADNVVITFANVRGTDYNSASTALFWLYDGGLSQYEVHSEGPADGGLLSDPVDIARLEEFSVYGFAAELQTDIRAEAAAVASPWTNPNNIDVTMNATTGVVTIAYPDANFSATFSTPDGAAFLGMSQNNTGDTSYTGSNTPSYLINPTSDYTSLSTPNYEPGGIGSVATANDGRSTGLARHTSPMYRDWVQQYEVKAKTLRLAATSAHWGTFQFLFEHCRGVFAFIVSDGFGESYDEAFRLRSDGLHWEPERATPGNDAQFHINFRAIVEGQMGGPPA